MKKIHTTAINRKLNEGRTQFIEDCEQAYCSQIKAAAESIFGYGDERPLILLSGPSGAGKTTTALKLSEYLDEMGICTHTVSMDDYFLPAEQNPRALDENGKIDFESPHRLDIDLLNEHMMKIANCEEVILPDFNFKEQRRYEGTHLKRKHGDLVVFEGIHALNPEITGATDGFANCIYVSVRTRVQTQSGGVMHPSHIRLMRRIIRDKLYRARKAEDTIGMFASVERGENLYIMPYKQRAQYNIDTFIPYELSVYKHFLQSDFQELAQSYSDFGKFELMEQALNELEEIEISYVPSKSLVREFIGGSGYKY